MRGLRLVYSLKRSDFIDSILLSFVSTIRLIWLLIPPSLSEAGVVEEIDFRHHFHD